MRNRLGLEFLKRPRNRRLKQRLPRHTVVKSGWTFPRHSPLSNGQIVWGAAMGVEENTEDIFPSNTITVRLDISMQN